MSPVNLNPIVASIVSAPEKTPERSGEPASDDKVKPENRRPIQTRFLPDRISAIYGGQVGFYEPANTDDELSRAVILSEMGAPRYYLGLKLSGQGDFYEYLPNTSLGWALELNYHDIVNYRKSINTDYDMVFVNPYVFLRGWVGYSGINVFGWEVMEDSVSVPEQYLTRANPEISDLVYGGFRVGAPFDRGNLVLFGGMDMERGLENYYRGEDGFHLREESIIIGGVKGNYGGYNFQVEGGYGSEGEERIIIGGNFDRDFGRFTEDLLDPRYRLVRVARFNVKSPEYGPASYSLGGDYKTYGEDDITQWGLAMRAHFGWGDVGLGYDYNPYKHVGKHEVYRLDLRYPWDPSSMNPGGSRIATQMVLNPSLSIVNMPDGETMWMLGIGIDGDIGSAGSSGGVWGGPTVVERPNRRQP